MQVKPITPEEAKKCREDYIPAEIIEVTNEFICKHLSNGRARFTQDELVTEILKRMPNLSSQDLFYHKYLDFEPLFEEAGWDVSYYKPSIGDDFKACFVFEAK